MNFKKLNPWNWFKHEDSIQEGQSVVPVKREDYSLQAGFNNPMQQFHQEVDRLFDDAFSRFGLPSWNRLNGNTLSGWDSRLASVTGRLEDFQPQLNVSSDSDGYTITLEAAGLSEKDISIEQIARQLIIRGNKQQEVENNDRYFYRIERHYGEFQRILDLPADARTEDIKATMANGLLTIHLPRQEKPSEEVHQIAISKS